MKKKMATKADIHEIAVDMAEFFHSIGVKMDETSERVTIIEDHVDMPHPKENESHFQKELLCFAHSFLVRNLFTQRSRYYVNRRQQGARPPWL